MNKDSKSKSMVPLLQFDDLNVLKDIGEKHINCLEYGIQSLNKIYEILRGTDLWYATCSEISHYLESYDFTDLIKIDNNKFEIIYKVN